MKTTLLNIEPVLPSANIERDVAWYKEKTGFAPLFYDKMYAVLKRENLCIHLQWHADSAEDPLLGGSVIRIAVKNIQPIFEELIKKGTVTESNFRSGTDWGTREFGFHDLNNNAIIIMEDQE